MPWLVRDGKVLATLEVATSMRDRTRGLLGRDTIDGALLLRPARSVHTLRMRFPIDVAFCDRDLRVLRVVTLARNRVTRPVLKAHSVIESEAGTMARWGVRVGDQLEVRGLDDDDGVIDVRDRRPEAASGPGAGADRTSRGNGRVDGDGEPALGGHGTAPSAGAGPADLDDARRDPAPRPPADIVGDGDGSRG